MQGEGVLQLCPPAGRRTYSWCAKGKNIWTNALGDEMCWLLIFLLTLSPCLAKDLKCNMTDWMLVTWQKKFSGSWINPGGMNDLWKAAVPFLLFSGNNSMSSRSWSRPAGDQCTLDKVHFSQCSPLLGGNQAEERNQLLQKDLRARKWSAPFPSQTPAGQCWCSMVNKFWVFAWRNTWKKLQYL